MYHLYWYYQVNRELKDYGVGTNPVLWLLAQFPGALLIVPPFVSWWRFFGRLRDAQGRAGCAERVDHTTGIVLYLIAFFLVPFELVYAQQDLNALWEKAGSARAYPRSVRQPRGPPADCVAVIEKGLFTGLFFLDHAFKI